jgi:hypothetical protein
MKVPWSPQPEKRQDSENNNNKAHEIDNVVHVTPLQPISNEAVTKRAT